MKLGFASILGLIFITLKLTNVIAWSWLLVLSPFWIVIALWFILAFLVILVTAMRS